MRPGDEHAAGVFASARFAPIQQCQKNRRGFIDTVFASGIIRALLFIRLIEIVMFARTQYRRLSKALCLVMPACAREHGAAHG